ncbi:MAG: flagellar basal body P-ring formation chaperone FlgA [candidate division Zixibacteria bacterium]|nr:flagellar basal body P-ring formation chaperone FlgA [candidate division Zixibacteria bacterium]
MMAKFLEITIALMCIGLLWSGTAAALSPDEAIVRKMFAMYELDPEWYQIELLNHPFQTAEVQEGAMALRPLSQKEPLGLFSAMVTINDNGEAVEQGQVRMRIRRFADVLTAGDRFGRHDVIGAEDVVLKRMDVTSLVEKPLTSLEELAATRVKRNINKGSILTTAAMEAVPDIEKGREVQIIYADGLCQVSTTGVVMQTGMAGDYIKVKNKTSGKIIVARVIDDTAVAVDP